MAILLRLGWSNPDTGPCSLRLYALDQGDQPRWAEPHARVAEVPLMEQGHREGARFVLVGEELLRGLFGMAAAYLSECGFSQSEEENVRQVALLQEVADALGVQNPFS